MLTKLLIRNFQCHEKLVIEFDPGITTIVGDTDQGKSAIVRALAWLALNRPSGTDFIKHDTIQARVTLITNERKIRRTRSKSENVYEVDGKALKAFSFEVPEEIRKAIGLDTLNFQFQQDSPFWFSNSAGEVSRALNQIVDLGIVDHVLHEIHQQVRQTRDMVETRKNDLAQAEQRVKELEHVKKMHLDFAYIETLSQQCEVLREDTASIQSLVDNAKQFSQQTRVEIPDSLKIDTLRKSIHRLECNQRALFKLIEQARLCRAELREYETRAASAHEQIHELTKESCPLCGAQNRNGHPH